MGKMTVLSSILLFALCCMVASAQNVQPKATYCKIDKQHVMCRFNAGPSKACNQPQGAKLTQQQKNAIVAKHNELRSKVALGQTSLPQAANMRKMVWDNELEAMAQRWADQCVDSHYKPGDDELNQKCFAVPRFSVGENTAGRRGPSVDWVSLVQGWYTKEVSGITEELIDSSDGGTSGHATQVIWAESHRVGCGIMQQKDKIYGNKFNIFCDYGPAANVLGAKVYIRGDPGTNCEEGTEHEESTGLCV